MSTVLSKEASIPVLLITLNVRPSPLGHDLLEYIFHAGLIGDIHCD
jgi:hypothetical protein